MGAGAGLYMYDVVVKKFTFGILSPDEFLSLIVLHHNGSIHTFSAHAVDNIGVICDTFNFIIKCVVGFPACRIKAVIGAHFAVRYRRFLNQFSTFDFSRTVYSVNPVVLPCYPPA